MIEFKALTLAEVVARQAASSRSTYAEHVAGKLKSDGTGQAPVDYLSEPGNVPLPAQFLKLVGKRASADSGGLYRYQPISKWNLGEGQGLRDDFQRWAWSQLEAEDEKAPAGPIKSDRAMVGAIASLGRAMQIPTIAEWVEDDATRDQVRQLGVDYAQRYGIEKPHPI